MFKQALQDGNVWLAIGLFCLALFFALEQWVGPNSSVEFIFGLFIGLATAAFAVSIVLLVLRAGQQAQKPAQRTAPSKKPRR